MTNVVQEMGSANEKASYWDVYYSGENRGRRPIPSQFATFAANEANNVGLVIDLACGTGRDSFFFGQHFPDVLGVDGSSSAIALCKQTAEALDVSNVRFCEQDIGASDFPDLLRREISSAGNAAVMIYARFFLHAITEAEEAAFFAGVASALRTGDTFALEYRTIRDASGRKETKDHYRRFVTAAHTDIALSKLNLELAYSVEGFGLAKYKHDDAYVARGLYIKE